MNAETIEQYVRRNGRKVTVITDVGGPEDGPMPVVQDEYIRFGNLELREMGEEVLLTATNRRTARLVPEFIRTFETSAAVVIKDTTNTHGSAF